MQNLDPNSLFNIFEQGDEAVYEEHGVEEVLQNPYVLMGMVLRGIENYKLLEVIVKKRYPDEWKAQKHIVKHKYFNKLYTYLERIKIDDSKEQYKVSNAYDLEETAYGLGKLLFHFEDIEEYEKCANIKKYIDILYDASADVLELPKI